MDLRLGVIEKLSFSISEIPNTNRHVKAKGPLT
jgi:hypothetical protein